MSKVTYLAVLPDAILESGLAVDFEFVDQNADTAGVSGHFAGGTAQTWASFLLGQTRLVKARESRGRERQMHCHRCACIHIDCAIE